MVVGHQIDVDLAPVVAVRERAQRVTENAQFAPNLEVFIAQDRGTRATATPRRRASANPDTRFSIKML